MFTVAGVGCRWTARGEKKMDHFIRQGHCSLVHHGRELLWPNSTRGQSNSAPARISQSLLPNNNNKVRTNSVIPRIFLQAIYSFIWQASSRKWAWLCSLFLLALDVIVDMIMHILWLDNFGNFWYGILRFHLWSLFSGRFTALQCAFTSPTTVITWSDTIRKQ